MSRKSLFNTSRILKAMATGEKRLKHFLILLKSAQICLFSIPSAITLEYLQSVNLKMRFET